MKDKIGYPQRIDGPLQPIAPGNRLLIRRPHISLLKPADIPSVGAKEWGSVGTERHDHPGERSGTGGRGYLAISNTRLEQIAARVILLPCTHHVNRILPLTIKPADANYSVHYAEFIGLPTDHEAVVGFWRNRNGGVDHLNRHHEVIELGTKTWGGRSVATARAGYQPGDLVNVNFGGRSDLCVVLTSTSAQTAHPNFRRLSVIQSIPYRIGHSSLPICVVLEGAETAAEARTFPAFMVRTVDDVFERGLKPQVNMFGRATRMSDIKFERLASMLGALLGGDVG